MITLPQLLKRPIAIIQKTFQKFDKSMVINLCKSYIRPILEYGNIVWGPQYIIDQQNIEKVQRRATKLIHNLHDRTYDDRLVKLNLPSLKYRRRRGDMIMIYQLLHNNLNIDSSELLSIYSSSITFTNYLSHNHPLEQDLHFLL